MTMESKHIYLTLQCILVVILFGFARADLAKDREQCTDQLVGLAGCLPYVGGDSKAPTLECCTGLKQVLQKNKKCLCVLIKDRDDPNLGLKINVTLALGLPQACRTPTDVGDCPALLQLPPNSPDAKVFEDFAKKLKANNSTSTTTPGGKGNNPSSAEIKSDGTRGARWLGPEMALGLLITVMLLILPNF